MQQLNYWAATDRKMKAGKSYLKQLQLSNIVQPLFLKNQYICTFLSQKVEFDVFTYKGKILILEN